MNKIKYLSLVVLVLILSGCPASHNNVRHNNNGHNNNNNGHNQANLVCATSQTTCATSNGHLGSSCQCHHDGHTQSGTVVNSNNHNNSH